MKTSTQNMVDTIDELLEKGEFTGSEEIFIAIRDRKTFLCGMIFYIMTIAIDIGAYSKLARMKIGRLFGR